jgi:hypothetical protein
VSEVIETWCRKDWEYMSPCTALQQFNCDKDKHAPFACRDLHFCKLDAGTARSGWRVRAAALSFAPMCRPALLRHAPPPKTHPNCSMYNACVMAGLVYGGAEHPEANCAPYGRMRVQGLKICNISM